MSSSDFRHFTKYPNVISSTTVKISKSDGAKELKNKQINDCSKSFHTVPSIITAALSWLGTHSPSLPIYQNFRDLKKNYYNFELREFLGWQKLKYQIITLAYCTSGTQVCKLSHQCWKLSRTLSSTAINFELVQILMRVFATRAVISSQLSCKHSRLSSY